MRLSFPSRAVALAGLSFLFVATFHIPDSLFRHGFDKTAPAQFVSIALVAAAMSLYIAMHSGSFHFHQKLTRIALALVGALVISALMSGNIIGSLFGDTGRFVGVISSLSLLIVAIYHSRYSFADLFSLIKCFVVVVQVVVLLGFAQHFGWLTFPGVGGIQSTLGNIDFFAALVATTLPLVGLLAYMGDRTVRILAAGIAALDIYALKIAGPKQAWVDIAIIAVAVVLYFVARKLPRKEISLNKRTYLGTLAIIIWSEIIFLTPFLGDKVPFIGDDIQVKIRTNFWITGIRQFFSHPLLGVGPDQYGNYYEKYRTIDDVKMWPNILSNDAHSASVQTLATTGIIGTLLFIALLAVVIRSLLILWDRHEVDRKIIAILSLYLFVYLTNSFVSPITPAHKYLFWAVCGFIVGRVFLIEATAPKKTHALAWLIPTAGLATAALLFTQAHITYLAAMEKYAADNSAKIEYAYNPLLPCFMYLDAQFLVEGNFSKDAVLNRAQEFMDTNPRCVRAITYAAQAAADRDDMASLGPLLNDLEDVAPWRSSTISLEMFYANRTHNAALAAKIEKRMHELGLVYVPGKLG